VLCQRFLQVGDVPLRVLGDLVVHGELTVHIHPQLRAREVSDVPVRCANGIAVTQVFLDRLRPGGRFDDDERLVHIGLLPRVPDGTTGRWAGPAGSPGTASTRCYARRIPRTP